MCMCAYTSVTDEPVLPLSAAHSLKALMNEWMDEWRDRGEKEDKGIKKVGQMLGHGSFP